MNSLKQLLLEKLKISSGTQVDKFQCPNDQERADTYKKDFEQQPKLYNMVFTFIDMVKNKYITPELLSCYNLVMLTPNGLQAASTHYKAFDKLQDVIRKYNNHNNTKLSCGVAKWCAEYAPNVERIKNIVDALKNTFSDYKCKYDEDDLIYIDLEDIRHNQIDEKLKLDSDIKYDDYEEKFGKGELKTFAECDIYKIERLGMKYIRQDFPNRQNIYDKIKEYFNDNTDVWVVTQTSKNDVQMSKQLLDNINNPEKVILQSVALTYYQQGYYLKELSDGQIVLCIKYFRTTGKIWKTKYIFKL